MVIVFLFYVNVRRNIKKKYKNKKNPQQKSENEVQFSKKKGTYEFVYILIFFEEVVFDWSLFLTQTFLTSGYVKKKKNFLFGLIFVFLFDWVFWKDREEVKKNVWNFFYYFTIRSNVKKKRVYLFFWFGKEIRTTVVDLFSMSLIFFFVPSYYNNYYCSSINNDTTRNFFLLCEELLVSWYW